MSSFDFLAEQQPTATTVQALYYLDNFFNDKPWKSAPNAGLAFKEELKSLNLDYSIDSLNRIDGLLDKIRTEFAPTEEEFLSDINHQNFLFVLCFYCGELLGRANETATVWFNYDEYIEEYPSLSHVFPAVFANFFVCRIVEKNSVNNNGANSVNNSKDTDHREPKFSYFFPLVAICDKLFNPEPEKSVCFSTTTFIARGLNPKLSLPAPPANYLNFSITSALANMPKAHISYLQILPPQWLHSDVLFCQMKDLAKFYTQGKVVWGALIQANSQLFEHDNSSSCPAEVIYDKTGRTDPDNLRHFAKKLFALKNNDNEDKPSELEAYGEHLSNEYTRSFTEITSIAHIPLQVASIYIWRPHLPNGILTLPIFPLLIHEDSKAVMILPAKFWQHTEFYQTWLSYQSEQNKEIAQHTEKNTAFVTDNFGNQREITQEIVPAYSNFIKETPNPWQNYEELIYPQHAELSNYMGTSINDNLAHNNKVMNHGSEAISTEEDIRFVRRCYHSNQADYRRFIEDIPDNKVIEDCLQQLKANQLSTYPKNVQTYAKLRLLDLDFLLEELANPDYNQRLQQKPLPKIADIIKQQRAGRAFSKSQQRQVVQFLHKLAEVDFAELIENESLPNEPQKAPKNSTTAILYLGYLYLTGTFVIQSIREASARFMYANGLGDWRAKRLLAELTIALPELAPILWREEISNQSLDLSFHFMTLPVKLEAFDEQKQAYLNYPPAMIELARQTLIKAGYEGHPKANLILQKHIEQQKIPATLTELKARNFEKWLEHYLNNIPEADKTDTAMFSYVEEDEELAEGKTGFFSLLGSIISWAVLLAIFYGIYALFIAEDEVSEPPTTTVTTPIPTQKPIKTTIKDPETPSVNANTLATAVDNLQSQLPFTFQLDKMRQVNKVTLNGDTVNIDIQQSKDVIISIEGGKSLFCYERNFSELQRSHANINLIFYKTTGEHFYSIDMKADECR